MSTKYVFFTGNSLWAGSSWGFCRRRHRGSEKLNNLPEITQRVRAGIVARMFSFQRHNMFHFNPQSSFILYLVPFFHDVPSSASVLVHMVKYKFISQWIFNRSWCKRIRVLQWAQCMLTDTSHGLCSWNMCMCVECARVCTHESSICLHKHVFVYK